MTKSTAAVTRTGKTTSARGVVRARRVLGDLANRLEQLDPGADEALELARQGLTLEGSNYSYEVLQSKVIAAWAAQIAAQATRGVTHLDRSEVLSEARLWLLTQLKEFRPSETGGNVGAFIRTRQTWFRSEARRTGSGQTRTHGRFAVLGTIGRVREEYITRHHREPTTTELRDAVTALLQEQAREKILTKADGSGLTLTEAELTEAVRRRLSKDGVLAALEDIEEVRREARADLPLQLLETEESEAPHWGVPLPTVAGPEVEQLDPEQDYERLLQVALGDHQWARTALSLRAGETPSGADAEPGNLTLRALAAESGASVSELRELLQQARVRVHAPHAHFAHLADLSVEHS